jgi:hypothetical protein
MLVQAQGAEAQAARGFWGGPGKKKSKIVWQRLTKLSMAATYFVYFISLTFVYKQFKYQYVFMLL